MEAFQAGRSQAMLHRQRMSHTQATALPMMLVPHRRRRPLSALYASSTTNSLVTQLPWHPPSQLCHLSPDQRRLGAVHCVRGHALRVEQAGG